MLNLMLYLNLIENQRSHRLSQGTTKSEKYQIKKDFI